MSNPLYFKQVQLGPMANYVYLVGDAITRKVAVVDPAWDIDAILKIAAQDDVEITHALVTHYHPDHVGGQIFGYNIAGLAGLLAKQPVRVVVNKHEAAGVRQVTGVSESDLVKVEGGDTLTIGETEIRFLHTPGHTPGSQCFLVGDHLVSGDTLFIGGCGRVDLPGGDAGALYDSLNNVLMKLPDQTLLYPGHAYSDIPWSQMGREKQTNHYLKVPSREAWLSLMGR